MGAGGDGNSLSSHFSVGSGSEWWNMSMDESLLFFGRTKTVTLTPSPVGATLCRASGWDFPDSFQEPASVALPWSEPGVLAESNKVAHAGNTIIFPQVPATLPVPSCAPVDASETPLPSRLLHPLQKATSSQVIDLHNILVYTSGARSAIFKEGSELFRLKGCGMGIDNSSIQDAFPTRYIGSDDLNPLIDPNSPIDPEDLKKPIEIRGAMFDFTVKREQAINLKVNAVMRLHNMPSANFPLGYYKYVAWKAKTHDDINTTCSLCCGLYKTLGDKRLASHLLWGLELLISHIFTELKPQSKDLDNDSQLSQDKAVSMPRKSWIEHRFLTDRYSGDELIDTGFAALEGVDKLLDLHELPIDSAFVISRKDPPNMPNGSDSIAWNDVWTKEWKVLIAAGGAGIANALANLYWLLGWQTGTIVRAIHDANINWGTYEDLLGNHCNSHPNNLVVLQQPSNGFVLAPLDFDLAFTRETYQTPKVTQRSELDSSWAELKAMETQGMLLALGGLNLNSGVEGKADIPPSYEPIRIALRDTIVKAFDAAYNKREMRDEDQTSNHHLHQSLIRLALILSENVVA